MTDLIITLAPPALLILVAWCLLATVKPFYIAWRRRRASEGYAEVQLHRTARAGDPQRRILTDPETGDHFAIRYTSRLGCLVDWFPADNIDAASLDLAYGATVSTIAYRRIVISPSRPAQSIDKLAEVRRLDGRMRLGPEPPLTLRQWWRTHRDAEQAGLITYTPTSDIVDCAARLGRALPPGARVD